MRKQQTIIQYLEEYILMCLDEVLDTEMTDFLLGEIYAYVECLEIIWGWKGVDTATMIAFEKKCGIW